MRIAFLGKGGSGKTTVSSLVTRIAPEIFSEVYVIDSDINMHMKGALGMEDQDVHKFLPIFTAYEKNIRSIHPRVDGLASLPRTLPLWDKQQLQKLSFDIAPFNSVKPVNNTMVFELGGYSEKNMGWSCHHNSLGKLQLVLGHTGDNNNQLIISDLTAGADVFGVGMLGLFDAIFVVVEPTLKSTGIFNQLRELAEVDELDLIPIANKVLDESDLAFIESQIGINPKYVIGMSNFVRRLERGESVTTEEIESENRKTILDILSYVKAITRDEAIMYRAMVKGHTRAADNWPKDKFGDVDLRDLVNPAFKGL